ncbi:hypothetical protein CEXT_115521 [Caerostris extrusa]|uniref:Uncharacterized protein n=1 Tax=Caerostris extrusa TaxID=172846 RepID=A0AAV4TPP6_CAEEX|nr:hypothetical protein CEXT_115521 [Caerostris extrusa]
MQVEEILNAQKKKDIAIWNSSVRLDSSILQHRMSYAFTISSIRATRFNGNKSIAVLFIVIFACNKNGSIWHGERTRLRSCFPSCRKSHHEFDHPPCLSAEPVKGERINELEGSFQGILNVCNAPQAHIHATPTIYFINSVTNFTGSVLRTGNLNSYLCDANCTLLHKLLSKFVVCGFGRFNTRHYRIRNSVLLLSKTT